MRKLYLRIRSEILRLLSRFIFNPVPSADLVMLGSTYGRWVVPANLLSRSSICYCGGVGEDITFDLALIDHFGCQVFAFDPTPRAAKHVAKTAQGIQRFHFQSVGLWSSDTTLKFYAPENPKHVSHSIVNLQGTSDFFEAPCRRLSGIMKDLGHAAVDLVKLDIEGAEYEVLDSMISDGLLPTILCVEFDQPVPFRNTFRAVRKLEMSGYRLASIDLWNYTFVRHH